MTILFNSKYFNKVYLPHVWDKQRFQLYMGGAGSGKSYFLAQRCVLNSFLKCNNILVARKYSNTNRASTFSLIKHVIHLWDLAQFFKINDLHITNTLSGSLILFTGLDDVLKLKSIHGIQKVWILLATDISRLDFQQINIRLRGRVKLGSAQAFQIWFSFNPVSITHWIRDYFFVSNSPHNVHNHDPLGKRKFIDMSFIKTTYKDNEFIDDEFISEVLSYKLINPYMYQVYALGLWGNIGLLIFTNWDVKDFDKNYILLTSNYISSGLDFGYNDPTVCCTIAYKDLTIYVLLLLYERKLTNTDLKFKLSETEYAKKYKIYADSSLPQRIAELLQAGYNILPVHKKTIKLSVNNLKKYKIIIHPTCTKTIRLISAFQYGKDKKTGLYIDLIPPQLDHCMDAIRYATMYLFFNELSVGKVRTGW